MHDLVHSSKVRPDLVQTNQRTRFVHSSRSSIGTNGRDETHDDNRTPHLVLVHAAPINRDELHRPGIAGLGASLPFLPPFVPAGDRADIALTCPDSVRPDLRFCGALRSLTQEVQR